VTYLRSHGVAIVATLWLMALIAGVSAPLVSGLAVLVGIPCMVVYVHELRERWHR
jgi:hypothetical protein